MHQTYVYICLYIIISLNNDHNTNNKKIHSLQVSLALPQESCEMSPAPLASLAASCRSSDSAMRSAEALRQPMSGFFFLNGCLIRSIENNALHKHLCRQRYALEYLYTYTWNPFVFYFGLLVLEENLYFEIRVIWLGKAPRDMIHLKKLN